MLARLLRRKFVVLYLLSCGLLFNIYLDREHIASEDYINSCIRRMLQVATNGKMYFTHEFAVFTNIATLDDVTDFDDVTVVTQLDFTKLNNVITLVDAWEGPMQVAVHLPMAEDLKSLLDLVEEIRVCNPNAKRYVEWRVVTTIRTIGAVLQYIRMQVTKPRQNFNCTGITERITALSSTVCRKGGECRVDFYPVNIMRNVARKAAKTKFILSLDSDLIPSKNMRILFLNFAQKCGLLKQSGDVHINPRVTSSEISCANSARENIFIFPTFEIRLDTGLPQSFGLLLDAFFVRKDAHAFHHWCPGCYHYTNHQRFLQESKRKPGVFDVAYTVDFHEYYEPYHISRSDVPLYDESFRGYGFNKASHILELAAAGHTFNVMRGAFLVHKGWSVPTSGQKWKEQHHNKPIFYEFRWNIRKKYNFTY